jgi:hypothetical protein
MDRSHPLAFGSRPFFSSVRHGFSLFCRDRIHLRCEKETRVEGHYSACRDHHRFARLRIPSRARALSSDCQPAKGLNGDRSSFLMGLEKPKEPFHQLGCLGIRDPYLLMNVPGNIRLAHGRSFPFGRYKQTPMTLARFARYCLEYRSL